MKTIQYAIDKETGLVYSRVGSEIAIPVLDYEGMLPENNFAMTYNLERDSVMALAYEWHDLVWTRKIPIEIKNLHRQFWNMPLLRGGVA